MAASPEPSAESGPHGKPTRVRYVVLGVATANAFLMYLDRVCMTTVVHSPLFMRDLGLNDTQVGDVLSSFFFAYALGQLPAGWLADRFGTRRMLVCYIALWSLFTALTGFVASLAAIVIVRLACGLSEAGAYPASSRMITRWFPLAHRARASGLVAFGGRAGNALAPWLTVAVIGAFGSWRTALWIYGGAGLFLAALTWWAFRDTPAAHPSVNAAERAVIGAPAPSVKSGISFPWRALLRHRGMWLLSLGGIGMNFGWALLITWMQKYLREVRGLGEGDANFYVTLALGIGITGMLFGGWWCDALTRWFGVRRGRQIPVVVGGIVGATAYLICPMLGSAAAVAIASGVVAFAVDSASPAIWALTQDIGRNHAASTMAWSNMWGNLGASALAKVIPLVIAGSLHRADWSEVFWLCAAGFALLAVSILFVDGTSTLEDPQDAKAR